MESEIHTGMRTKNSNRVGPTCQRWLGRIRITHDVTEAGRWDQHARASGRERMGHDVEVGRQARLEREKEIDHEKEFSLLELLGF